MSFGCLTFCTGPFSPLPKEEPNWDPLVLPTTTTSRPFHQLPAAFPMKSDHCTLRSRASLRGLPGCPACCSSSTYPRTQPSALPQDSNSAICCCNTRVFCASCSADTGCLAQPFCSFSLYTLLPQIPKGMCHFPTVFPTGS